MDCTGVHPKFDTRDPFALLALEMQVMVFQRDLGQLPFEDRRRDSEIGQRAHEHVAADPGEAVEVSDAHEGFSRWGKGRTLSGGPRCSMV